MPPTPVPRCKAHTRSGEQCRNRPIRGGTVCPIHGGSVPAVRARANQRLLEARVQGELTKRGWEPVSDPLAAYSDLAGEIWAFKEVLREKLAELSRWTTQNLMTGTDDVAALVAVYERALDRAQKTLADMLRIGIDAATLQAGKERPTREQAESLSRVLNHVLDALALTPEQRAATPQALRTALTMEGLL